MAKPTILQEVRAICGVSARAMGVVMDLDPTGYLRIERAQYTPTQDTARKIFDYYGGLIPIGLVYDQTHKSFKGFLTNAKKTALRRHTKKLALSHPSLQPKGRHKPRS